MAGEPANTAGGESLAQLAIHAVRTAATLAVIPLGLLPGLVVWLATRDRRRAIDRIIEAWGDWGTRAAGIALDVTLANDVPFAKSHEHVTKMGEGAAIKAFDASVVPNWKLVDYLRETCEARDMSKNPGCSQSAEKRPRR